ncbi:hypothetical protein KP509_01G093900 [Ceratopteris richardii]|nr:hypothetical protein KP509_01G093900 [Ceratopteris richardii]
MIETKVSEAQGDPCSGVMQQLSACAPFITTSASATPETSSDCCVSLQSVDVNCMCQVFNGPTIPNLDRSKALSLPQTCNLPNTVSCS